MNTIVTIYPTFAKRIDIHATPSWRPWGIFYNCLFLLFPKWFMKKPSIMYFSTSLPANRLPPMHFINSIINLSLLTCIAKQYKIKVLWIRDPDYFKLHNTIRYDYLILDCLPKIAQDPSKKFLYKKYFSRGRKFCYTFRGTNKTIVFKNNRDAMIIAHLGANKDL